jgi:tetratricopeptide (TPR) repeat protein
MLAFAAMMSGRSQMGGWAADELVRRISQANNGKRPVRSDGFLALPYEVKIRFGRWDEILAAPEPKSSFPIARTMWHFARGVAYAAKRDTKAARSEQQAFRLGRGVVPNTARFRNCSAHELLDLASDVLDGEISYREQNVNRAVSDLENAVLREQLLPRSDPPNWMLPCRHILGATLMDAGRYADAERVYRADLSRYPENGWALFGLELCLRHQSKQSEAIVVKARLAKAWADADVPLRSSCCCLPTRGQ